MRRSVVIFTLVWTGTEYGISWQAYCDANYEIFLRH